MLGLVTKGGVELPGDLTGDPLGDPQPQELKSTVGMSIAKNPS
jgi:hypothetical protein